MSTVKGPFIGLILTVAHTEIRVYAQLFEELLLLFSEFDAMSQICSPHLEPPENKLPTDMQEIWHYLTYPKP